MSQPWPDSHLKALEVAFGHLACKPAPIALDCRPIRGLPDTTISVGDLRTMLLNPTRPLAMPVKDAVWRELLIRARGAEAGWKVAAAGMAVPGLTKMAGFLARGWHGDTNDLDAELLIGFVERMNTISLDAERICGKLIDAAERAVKRARQWSDCGEYLHVGGAWSIPPRAPWDHPDWVLLRAVAAAYIDDDEYMLIGETRLGDVSLQVVADRLGIEVKLAAAWRRKAEERIRTAIAAGALEYTVIGTAARRRAGKRLGRAL